mgnify:CR=1 FL=1
MLNGVPPPPAAPNATTLKIHYHRADAAYAGWVLHAWKAADTLGSWDTGGYVAAGTDDFGVYYVRGPW